MCLGVKRFRRIEFETREQSISQTACVKKENKINANNNMRPVALAA